MRNARIAGTGLYVPPTLLTNAQLAEKLGKSLPDSLENKLGIKQRYVTGPELSSVDLGTNAALAAIADAGLAPQDIDLVVVATDTPEYISPPTAAVVQGRLGAVNAGAFDVNASCTGFVTALDMASRMIGYDCQYTNILVCGVYNMTKYVDPYDEKVAPIFADGGGAVVLQATEENAGFLGSKLYADGTQYDFLGIYAGGTRNPINHEAIDQKRHLLTFLKPLPPARNLELWPVIVPQALAKSGLTINDVDHFLFTQINRWAIEEVMKIFGQPMDKTTCIMDRYGYTGSACLPMALHHAVKEGRIKKGSIVAMVGSGVGLSAGAVIFRW